MPQKFHILVQRHDQKLLSGKYVEELILSNSIWLGINFLLDWTEGFASSIILYRIQAELVQK